MPNIKYLPIYNFSDLNYYSDNQDSSSGEPTYYAIENKEFPMEIKPVQIQGYQRMYAPTIKEEQESLESSQSSVNTLSIPSFLSIPVEQAQTAQTKSSSTNTSSTPVTKEHRDFSKHFENSNVKEKDKYREYFQKMAKRESGWNYRIANRDTSALGYFQFMPDNIKAFYRGSNFKKDPVGQIEAMEKYTNANLSQLTQDDLRKARTKGFTMSALAAGMHLGGLGGVRKVLNSRGNPKDANGTGVATYMKEFNGLFKKGGILKRK